MPVVLVICEYVFAEGAIAFPDSIDKPSRTMLTSESSKNRSTHIIEDPQTGRKRKITPLECERLQTLPDNYTEGCSNTQRYKQCGNGWTVDVIAHILRGLK